MDLERGRGEFTRLGELVKEGLEDGGEGLREGRDGGGGG